MFVPGSPTDVRELDAEKLRRYVQLARAERQRRRSGAASISPWARYRRSMDGFARESLDYHLWSKQREIGRSLVENRKTAVKSAHGVGKSFTAGIAVGWWIAIHPPGTAMVVTTAPTFPQVRAILWKEINRVHARGNLPGHTNMTEWLIGNELVAFGRKPQDEDPTAFQGIHAENLLVVLDEACGVPAALWVAADSLISNESGKMLAIGNPDDPHTEFGRVCRPGSGWNVITVSAYDSPNLTGEEVPDHLRKMLTSRVWVEDKERRWGPTNPLYISKVLGEFPEISEDTLISPRLVADAVAREIEPQPGDRNELGVDVARSETGNETVIYHRHGSRYRLWKAFRVKDTMRVVAEVVHAVRETGATLVKVDDPGVGGGVTDRLTEIAGEPSIDAVNPMLGVRVVGVNVGLPPFHRPGGGVDPTIRFANRKAQLSWELREKFVEGDVDLGDDLDTQAQICVIKTGLDRKNKMTIESKADVEERMRKLGGMSAESGSPDRWDALVLASADVDEVLPMVIPDDAITMAQASRRFASARFY